MDTKRVLFAIVKLVENSKSLSLSFDHLGKPRSFCRNVDEAIGDTLKRVALNISKQMKIGGKKSKKENGSGQLPIPNVALLDCSNSKIPNETLNTHAWKSGSVLMIDETSYKIALNPPSLLKFELPNSIMSGFAITPMIEYEFASLEKSRFQWFVNKSNISEDNTEWDVKSNEIKFIPRNDLIGHFVKLICYAGNETEEWPIPFEAISSEPISCGPGYCPFDQRHLIAGKIESQTIRVMSYNILADCYASSDHAKEYLFNYCPQYALDITYRRQLILKEITGFNPHIICLQECDGKQFDSFFQPAMKSFGYGGHFSNKAGETQEGEALFYNKNRFTHLANLRIVFKDAVETIDNPALLQFLNSVPDVKEELLKKSTIGQIILLLDNVSSKYLFILNTHLYFKANYDHFRIIQIATLVDTFWKFILSQNLRSDDYGILLCGDLNTLPDTAVLEFLTASQLLSNHQVWKLFKEEVPDNVEIKLPFKLKNLSGLPDFTNLTNGFKGTLDYIFGNDQLQVKGIVPISSQKELETYVALPSIVSPSDHVPIVCDLEWKASG